MGELERFDVAGGRMHRTYFDGERIGEVTITDDPAASTLIVTTENLSELVTQDVLARVGAMFDLDVNPAALDLAFGTDRILGELWRKHPGLRMASGWDPFEVAMVTILGQLVTVDWGRELLHQLIELAGEPTSLTRAGVVVKRFPTPERIVAADLTDLKTTGVRKQTLKGFSQALLDGTLSLDPEQPVDEFVRRALGIRGIGPWSANYMALRVLRHADAFPATDLILARALAHHPRRAIDNLSPYRGYVATLLWREYAELLSKARPRATV